jgi:coenzyme F420-reducing hydrogenase delta subunit
MPFPVQAQVSSSLCVSCGICVGSCPSSTPFRRSEELRTGIDLPDYSLRELRERAVACAATLTGSSRVMVLACERGAGAARATGTVVMPCVAMAPPSLIDFILSRNLADGVVVAGCPESACYNRLGVAWSEQRFAGIRDPHLRARVPRSRLATVWASKYETKRLEREITGLRAGLAELPPLKRSPLTASMMPAAPTADRHAPEEVGG